MHIGRALAALALFAFAGCVASARVENRTGETLESVVLWLNGPVEMGPLARGERSSYRESGHVWPYIRAEVRTADARVLRCSPIDYVGERRKWLGRHTYVLRVERAADGSDVLSCELDEGW